ncbi:MAG: YlxM family DNA-binding protein [Lachnospiraceae bacterium]|nr:YlxM family DNA-binding protein [Lachnospiraceae bacterium]
MDKIYQESLLFDFYGELLTKRQKDIYEEAVFNDYSLSEIAEEYGISRQAVHDLVKRAGKTLEGYEEKLLLVHKFLFLKSKVQEIQQLTDDDRIRKLSEEILEEL